MTYDNLIHLPTPTPKPSQFRSLSEGGQTAPKPLPSLPLRYIGKDFASLLALRLFLQTRTTGPSGWQINPVVSPIIGIDDLLWVPHTLWHQADPGATGVHVCFTVPNNKRWRVHSIRFAKLSGANVATSGVYLIDPLGAIGQETLIKSWSSSTDYVAEWNAPKPFTQGWKICAAISVYTAGDVAYQAMYYEEEDA